LTALAHSRTPGPKLGLYIKNHTQLSTCAWQPLVFNTSYYRTNRSSNPVVTDITVHYKARLLVCAALAVDA
jgi:hypothetical protein